MREGREDGHAVWPQRRGAQPRCPAAPRLLLHLLGPNRPPVAPGGAVAGAARGRGSRAGGAVPGGGFRRWPAPARWAAADPPPRERRENEEGFSEPRRRAPFVNLSVFPISGCGEIHAGSGLLQSLTGDRDLCPLLVCLILRLRG